MDRTIEALAQQVRKALMSEDLSAYAELLDADVQGGRTRRPQSELQELQPGAGVVSAR